MRKSLKLMAVTLASATLVGAGLSASSAESAPSDGETVSAGAVMIVVDASGSMGEPDGQGNTRMESAKAGLNGVIEQLPDDASVGLRAYGSVISDGPGSCEDSEVLVELDTVDKPALTAGVAELEPLGNTPIAYSLEQAAGDLEGAGDVEKTIVLVSDGEENCLGDPCEVAAELAASGINLHIDVVGLQVDANARNQLTCIASAGGGTYYDVDDIRSLPDTLVRVSIRAARGYSSTGTPVQGGSSYADAPTISDGIWQDSISPGEELTYLFDGPPTDGTMYLSATIRPTNLDLGEVETVRFTIGSAEDSRCIPQEYQGAGSMLVGYSAPVAAIAVIPADRFTSCGEGPHLLTIQAPRSEEERPLEIIVRPDGAVENVAELPPRLSDPTRWEVPEFPEAVAAEATEVLGSQSFGAAPTIEPGTTYVDDLLPEETLFYRVDVDWGQQLGCRVDITAPQRPDDAPVVVSYLAEIYTPMRERIGSSTGTSNAGSLDWGQASSATHVSPPVLYRNREFTAALRSVSIPGGYYCAVRLAGQNRLAGLFGQMEFTLRAEVFGTAGDGAPTYVTVESDDTEVDPGTPGDSAGSDDTDAAADDAPSWTAIGWVSGVGAAVIAALLGWLVWVRRRRSNESSS